MFQHYFDEKTLSLIVQQANLFAAQCLTAANRITTWETNLTEIRA